MFGKEKVLGIRAPHSFYKTTRSELWKVNPRKDPNGPAGCPRRLQQLGLKSSSLSHLCVPRWPGPVAVFCFWVFFSWVHYAHLQSRSGWLKNFCGLIFFPLARFALIGANFPRAAQGLTCRLAFPAQSQHGSKHQASNKSCLRFPSTSFWEAIKGPFSRRL